MLKFKRYLVEKTEDPNYGLKNDDKGKLHELLVGHFLMHGTAHHDPDSFAPTKSMPKFAQRPIATNTIKKEKKSKSQFDTPEKLHAGIKSKLTHEQYSNHIRIAKFAAEHIKKGLEDAGHLSKNPQSNSGRISNVYWTSRPADIERLHGSPDPANTSDIVVEKKKKNPTAGGRKLVVETDGGPKEGGEHIGISLKIHNEPKTSTLANPGRGTMDSAFLHNYHIKNTDAIEKTAINAAHAAAKSHGIDTSKMSKKEAHDSIKIGGKAGSKAESIREKYHSIAKNSLENVAQTYRNAMSTYNGYHLGNLLRKVANVKPTAMKMYKSATFGTNNLTHSFSNPAVEMESILKQHEGHIKVAKGGGTNIRFTGKDNLPIGNLAIKYGSSTPHTGIVGTLQGWTASAKHSVDPKIKKEVAHKLGY